MFQFDESFLQSVGLATMPDDEKQAFLQHIYQELQVRVGTRLSEGMDDKNLDDFEQLHKSSPQDAIHWLEANRPNYKQVVAVELARLQQEIIDGKDKLLSMEKAAA